MYNVVINNSSAATNLVGMAPAGWIATDASGLMRTVTLSNDVTGEAFGLFHGSKLSSIVFKDNGVGGATLRRLVKTGTLRSGSPLRWARGPSS